MLTLRKYQEDAVNLTYQWMSLNDGNPLIVLPTGAGKSLIQAKIVEDVLTHWPDQRVVCVTHVKELVSQNFSELKGLIPNAPAGIYSAGLGRRDKDAQILFCGIQSVYNKAQDLQRCNLLLIDEAHLLSNSQSSMYRQFIDTLRRINCGHLRVLGLTATPYRTDSGLLYQSEGSIFDAISYEIGLLDLINQGYLSKLISKRTVTQLDTSGVSVRGGDFVPGELEAAVDVDATTQAACNEIVSFGKDRKGWMVFGSGVQHCKHIAEALSARGIKTECVFGETEKSERDRIIRDFKQQKTRCLVGVSVLTVGFNARHVDLIAMMRPTKSAGLVVQIVGRGTRLSPETGKTDCLILDFSGNLAYHGPVDKIAPRPKQKGSGEAPTKTCPECKVKVFAGLRECPYCGFEFPPPESEEKISKKASIDPVLSTEAEIRQWGKVTSITACVNNGRDNKPDTMRVAYECGLATHNAYWCFDHHGYPREKAVNSWVRHGGQLPPPASVVEAVERAKYELVAPVAIAVKPNGKWTEIVDIKHT